MGFKTQSVDEVIGGGSSGGGGAYPPSGGGYGGSGSSSRAGMSSGTNASRSLAAHMGGLNYNRGGPGSSGMSGRGQFNPGGAGGGGGGGGGQFNPGNMPGPTPSQPGASPYGGAGESADALGDYGEGLLDPRSEMSKRWMEELRENIGRSTEASQRGSAYEAAQAGFGGGASPEALEMSLLAGDAGREAEGGAASDFMMRAPSMGVDALSRAMGAETGMRGQDLNARQAEMANFLRREEANSGYEMQQRGIDLERDRMEQDRYLRELMLEYGG